MSSLFRILYRSAGFFGWVAIGSMAHFLWIWVRGKAGDYHERARWTHYWGKTTLRILGVKLSTDGVPPRQGLLASNHLSYIDIIVYAACQPGIFVSKSEVRWWPVIGQLTRCAGTLFINREDRADVKRLAEAFAPRVDAGCLITLFPEGTSTGGDRVLPFHSSLFEPVAARKWPVMPAWIGYEVPGGDASEEVAYWKDMTFFPHLLHLFSLKEVRAFVRYGQPVPPGLNRKEIARNLHDQVNRFSEEFLSRNAGGGIVK